MEDTVAEGRIIALKDEKGTPFLFATEEEALKEIAGDMIQHLTEFIDGERDMEATDFQASDWVEYVEMDENGICHTEDGEVYTAEQKIALNNKEKQ